MLTDSQTDKLTVIVNNSFDNILIIVNVYFRKISFQSSTIITAFVLSVEEKLMHCIVKSNSNMQYKQ